MNGRHAMIGVLIVSTSVAHASEDNKEAVATIRHIVRSNPSSPSRARGELLRCLSGRRELPLDALRMALNRLFDFEPPVGLERYESVIFRSAEQFHNVPGFQETLGLLLSTWGDTLRYSVQKIDCALACSDADTPEQILAFDCQRESPRGELVRFDIRSVDSRGQEMLTMCEDIEWYRFNPARSKVATALLAQQEIARCNTTSDVPARYRVCSRQPATTGWRRWFREHDIVLCER